jgi:molecular chaperone IbpA|tara:strand:+ start:161 stop:586 length:426 start_codon:yes stop_codon:yes gene_type:complete
MVNSRLTIDPSRVNAYSIGFDRMFDMMSGAVPTTPNYPPYNIVKHSDDKYTIEIAVAGFSKDEIDVETKENTLLIESKSRPEGDDDKEFLHKGISNRAFKKAFTISDDVVVNGADMKDGILKIEMERIIPEEKKPRTIKIK